MVVTLLAGGLARWAVVDGENSSFQGREPICKGKRHAGRGWSDA